MLIKVVLGVNLFSTIRKILIITVVSVVIITLSKEASIFLSNLPSVQLTIGLLFAGVLMAIALYAIERNATIQELICMTKRKRDVI